MNTQIQKTSPPAKDKPSALALMATRLNVEPEKLLATLKSTVFKNATNEELLALVVVANTYGLEPLLKEIYAFPAKGGGIVPIVSVDGWNKMLIRQPDFDGIDFEFTDREDGSPYSCTATVHTKSRTRPVKITEYFDECKRNTDPWNNMPRRMLRNRTLCQASRVAFGFSGIYHEDEAAPIIEVSTPPPKTMKLVEDTAKVSETTAQAVEQKPEVMEATPQMQLESLVTNEGFDFNVFQTWANESGNIPDATSLADFGQISTEICNRLLRAKKGLLSGLKATKGLTV